MSLFSAETINHLLDTYGGGIVALAVLLECMGVPLPAETLFITAALHAGLTGGASIHVIVLAATAAAILGDNGGYWLGRRFGETLVVRYGARIGITEARIDLVRRLFARYGTPVIILGRFTALLRTLVSLAAGIARMEWRRFLVANAAGGVLWACSTGYGAYFLGDRLKRLETPIALGLAALVAAGFAAGIALARRYERRMEREAEKPPR